MAKKASVKELLETLAKERGIELKKESKKEKISGEGVSGKLEAGAGFGEAITETAKEKYKSVKEAVTTTKGIESLGKKAYKEIFKGEDIFSAYMRGRLKKYEDKKEKEDREISTGKSTEKVDADSATHLAIIAKQSMAIQGMARDTNVLRQNLQQLVKLWGGTAATKKEETEKKPKVDAKVESKTERAEDISYFAEQDKKEAEQEAARAGSPTPVGETKEAPKKEEGGNLLDNIISLFSSGFMAAIRFLFNPKMLMKVFSKVFVPLTIVATLFSGIMDGFKRYQETGSFTEAITAGLGGMLKFLTFEMFGEDTIKDLFKSISDFFDPVVKTISNIFTGIKDFFVGLFGGQVSVKDETPKEAAKVTPKESTGTAETFATPAGEATGTTATPVSKAETKKTEETTTPTKTPVDKEEKKKVEEAQQARADVDSMRKAEDDLRNLYNNWNNEKSVAIQNLTADVARFPNGINSDPQSPEYPVELKAIDDKYNKLIADKKTEIETYKKKPGVKEELKRQNYEEPKLDADASKKTPIKIGGTKYTTTEIVETASLAKTPEAKKADEELKALDEKQAKERKEAVEKAKNEGKITGNVASAKDFEDIGELKALKTKQEAERLELIKKIEEGTTTKTASAGGAAEAAGGVGSAGGAASAAAAGGGESGGGAPSEGGGETSPTSAGGGGSASAESVTPSDSGGGGAAAAPSASDVSPTPDTESTPPSVPSGSEISSESTKVAEEQRMESSADQGTIINSPTNSSTSQMADQEKKKPTNVYDTELINRLAVT